MNKIISLMKDIYDPFVHAYFALNWCFAFFLLWRGSDFSFEDLSHHWPVILTCSVILFFVLFYLRLVDEIKDYDYDKVFNPNRPLVSGKGSVNQFLSVSLVCLLVSLLLAINLGQFAVIFLLLHFTYSFSLWALESKVQAFKKSMSLNLLVTYPVNISLSVFLLVNYSLQNNAAFSFTGDNLMTIIVFATAFLYYEFSRKIDLFSRNDQKLYSNELGPRLSVLLNFVWPVLTIIGLWWLLETWISLILLIPVLWGFSRYKKEIPFPFKITGGIFLGLFYGFIICLQFIRAF